MQYMQYTRVLGWVLGGGLVAWVEHPVLLRVRIEPNRFYERKGLEMQFKSVVICPGPPPDILPASHFHVGN